jgi:hypothetical protein
MSEPPDGPKFRNAAERIMHTKRLKFESKNRELIEALANVGHEPLVRVSWSTSEGGGARVSLECERCGARRRLFLPERWQALSSDKHCEV